MSYRLKFDPDKCVGCYACHIACLDAHHDVEDVDAKSYRTVKSTDLDSQSFLRKMPMFGLPMSSELFLIEQQLR